MDGHTGTPCTREEPAKGDLPPTTTGDLTPQYPGGNLPAEAAAAPAKAAEAAPAKAAAAPAAAPAKEAKLQLEMQQSPFPQYEAQQPEKVLTPQTTWARYHSTYY
jgi:hypothetical protein